ncbi:ROK family transcriptional regulator [Paenibacillus puerhi]|uniref:ROK family transcriptional regulator n=1 Tax=Paenibacillus puerhi TaxID=2692622 RepID=UPI001F2A3663|nr:ROK family protein [Paenibacillus puerhi]
MIKQQLKSNPLVTKASIAQATGLSVSTCNTILNELVAAGEVFEMTQEESSGGRPAMRYKYNADFGCVACLMMLTAGGRSSIAYQVVNLLGEVSAAEEIAMDVIDPEVIERLLDKLIADYPNMAAIGIGIPGVVHQGIIGVCDVEQLAGQPLGLRLEQKYKLPITIENDMNMTVYGFFYSHIDADAGSYAVVTFPRNHYPGSGFMINGRVLSGSTTFGGEVSFLPFGMSREEQLRKLHTEEGFIQLAVHTLVSIIAIVNPATIAITGDLPREAQLKQLRQGCQEYIPAEHMPVLFVKNNTSDEYMGGLIQATLDSLSFKSIYTQ